MSLLGRFPMLIENCLARSSNLRSDAIQLGKNRLDCQRTFHESHVGFSYFPLVALCKNKCKRKIRKHSCMRPIVPGLIVTALGTEKAVMKNSKTQ